LFAAIFALGVSDKPQECNRFIYVVHYTVHNIGFFQHCTQGWINKWRGLGTHQILQKISHFPISSENQVLLTKKCAPQKSIHF